MTKKAMAEIVKQFIEETNDLEREQNKVCLRFYRLAEEGKDYHEEREEYERLRGEIEARRRLKQMIM